MERIIIKYANRKLYDKETKQYVTLSKVKSLVNSGESFRVIDNKTKQDITYNTLAIIAYNKLLNTDNKNENELISLINKG